MRKRGLALTVMLTAAVMDLLDGTVVNVVLPAIQRDLDASDTAAAWIAGGYTLALGVLLILGGRLGDLYGPRAVLLTSAAGFTGASLVCATATGPGVLVTARVVQGAMSALMVPQVLTLIQLLYPARQRGRALALFATVTGTATVSGPLVGALLTEADLGGLGWRAVFLVNLPLGVFVLAGGRTLPKAPSGRRGTLDVPGVLLLATGLLAGVLPLMGEHRAGWPGWTWPSLGVSVVLLAAFVVRERWATARGAAVLVDTRLFASRGFTGAVLINGLLFAAVFGFFFTLALYLQRGLDRDLLTAALTVLPWSLGIPVMSVPATRWLVPLGGRRTVGAGLVVLVVGLLGVADALRSVPDGPPTWRLGLWLLVAGCGMGLVVAPLLTLGLAEVPARLAGTASGVLSNVQQVAGAAGVAGVSAVYFAHTASPDPDAVEATAAFRWVVWCALPLCGGALWALRLLPAGRGPSGSGPDEPAAAEHGAAEPGAAEPGSTGAGRTGEPVEGDGGGVRG